MSGIHRRSWPAVLLAGVLLLGLAACGPDEAASPTPGASVLDSGITGTVLLGPTCAAQAADASPCVTPYAARLVILDSNGDVVTEISSGSDGAFRVTLPPGDYVIQPMPADGGIPNAPPQSVSVAPHEYYEVEIDYDTGIR